MKTKTGKKTVAIVGFAQTTMNEVQGISDDTELWTVNYAWHHQDQLPRIDRLFEIHDLEWLAVPQGKRSKYHYDWLHKEHDFVIYTLEDYKQIPSGEQYPFERLAELFKNVQRGPDNNPNLYMSSTISYMVALAILEGFERIELYGIEMSNGTEYGYQKAAMEFLLGYAAGRGAEVWVPETSAILSAKLYHEGGQMLTGPEINAHSAYYIDRRGHFQEASKHAAQDSDVIQAQQFALMYDGARLLCNQIYRTINGQIIGRQDLEAVAEECRIGWLEQFSQANFHAGVVSTDETNQEAREQAATYQQGVYRAHGAYQATNNLIRAIDLQDPSLKLTNIFQAKAPEKEQENE